MNSQTLRSYLYPILIKKYKSNFNGSLELSMQNGNLVVDSANANYSYGNLHKVFDKAIRQLKLDLKKTYNCLILGFGAGSIAKLLLHSYNINTNITGVEIDPVMLQIYKEHFDLNSDHIMLINENAFDFLESNKQSFDLIFIDLFIDLEVPHAAKDQYFLNQIKLAMHSQTKLCMNIIGKDKMIFFEKWQNTFERNDFRKDYFDLNTIFYSFPNK